LATSLASPLSAEAIRGETDRRERGFAAWLVTALTLLALAVHGYHPYAEDGGLYLPEIKRLLHPEMYPQGAEFVVGHLRFSIFAPVMAALVRGTHLGIETVLLLTHLASLWATLYAAWLLAARCYESREARCGAVALLAVWITLPIAGTSLMLMDPYVTARSFSTPCSLLALVGALGFLAPRRGDEEAGQDRGRWLGLMLCCGALAAGAAMHPLMAAYSSGCVLVLGCVMSPARRMRVWGTAGLCVAAVVVAGVLQMSGAPESEVYRRVVLTRYYWFVNEWHWYELMGLVAPLLIVAVVALRGRGVAGASAARVGLVKMTAVVGASAAMVAVLFARTELATHAVARLQPLRIFQVVYVVMILVVGAALAERVLRRSTMRWVMAFSLLAGLMVFVERRTYPESARVELPWAGLESKNAWEQAFVWIRRNTPEDALFALDSHYITSSGEDAQGFRAIAERSVLPDYSKDGGVVANKPGLSAEWMTGQRAQTGLNTESDAARLAALRPLGVDWVVLDRSVETEFHCEYANGVVKVCRLP
jgi:hypothetical protein